MCSESTVFLAVSHNVGEIELDEENVHNFNATAGEQLRYGLAGTSVRMEMITGMSFKDAN